MLIQEGVVKKNVLHLFSFKTPIFILLCKKQYKETTL